MPEMRKCKECGKLFTPKGREQYCHDIHYRPCPNCGELVIAKYLSDPPRRCDKCKGRKSKPAEVSKEVKLIDKSKTSKPKEEKPKNKQLFKMPGFNTSFEMKPMTAIKPIAPVGTPSQQKETKDEPKIDNKQNETTPSQPSKRQYKIPDTIDSSRFCEERTGSTMEYIGNPHINSFIPGHTYLLKIERDDYVYWVTSVEDITCGEIVDIAMPYASQISFYQNFAETA